MRLLATALALCCLPRVASAQSWHVLHATLHADGVEVGALYGAAVRPVAWTSDVAPRVAYSDSMIALDAELSLADERTFVSIGVGRSATVRTGTGFRIEMRPLSWAPLLARAPGGVRVALPPGLPAPNGVLVGAVEAPAGADPPMDAFAHVGPPRAFDPACGTLRIRATPQRRAPVWTIDGERAAIHLAAERDGLTRARVFVDGFVVHGWLEGALPDCAGAISMGGLGTACGDGYGTGLVVTLAAGTELFASPTARRPFARLRADTVGIEPVHDALAQACANGICRRVPAEPTGPARWILHAHAGAGGWSLTAWVRTPAEQLARPADGSSGFGGCWSPPSEWPRL